MKSTRKVLIEKELSERKKEKISFDNMSFFKEAAHRKLCGYGYRAERHKLLWQSKNFSWNHIMFEWGIRDSNIFQIIPIWNISHNGRRALMFGFWKLYFSIIYYRKSDFNQDRKLPFRKKLWKFYQLVS